MFVYEKDGRKRQATEKTCLNCEKLFLVSLKEVNLGKGKFCSKECFNYSQRKRIILTCALCNIQFERKISQTLNSKSGIQFCSRNCKDLSQRIGGILAIMPSHYGTARNRSSDVYRRLYKEFKNIEKFSCERCGYSEFECGVEIHHIDGDFLNNKLDNLKALCANCHRALHNNLWNLNHASG